MMSSRIFFSLLKPKYEEYNVNAFENFSSKFKKIFENMTLSNCIDQILSYYQYKQKYFIILAIDDYNRILEDSTNNKGLFKLIP
jgi:hypothetical protein